MTPLELSILIHYKGAARDFRDGDFSAPAVREAIEWFCGEAGMLEPTSMYSLGNDFTKATSIPHTPAGSSILIGTARTQYKLTEKGNYFVDQLCEMPLPVS